MGWHISFGCGRDKTMRYGVSRHTHSMGVYEVQYKHFQKVAEIWHDGDQRMYYGDVNNLEYLDLYDPPTS